MISQKNKAFTLVELIVVIVILAILSTIAFLSFNSYSSSSRDSVRLADITNIAKGLTLQYTVGGYYILPDNSVNLYSGSTLIGYQGKAGSNTLNTIKLSANTNNTSGRDPIDNTYYTYNTNINKNRYQVTGYLENKGTIINRTSYIYNGDSVITRSDNDVAISFNNFFGNNANRNNEQTLNNRFRIKYGMTLNELLSFNLIYNSFQINQTYATTYTNRFPYLKGDSIGVILNYTGTTANPIYTPIEDITTSTGIDISSGTLTSGKIVISNNTDSSTGVSVVIMSGYTTTNTTTTTNTNCSYFPGEDGVCGTPDDCNTANIVLGNGQVWSACNLGAKTAFNSSNGGSYTDGAVGSSTRGGDDNVNGKLYQWGRNKGFSSSDTSQLSTQLSSNPNGTDTYNFVWNATLTNNDWLNPQINTLWGGSTSDSGTYDGQTDDTLRQGPCPSSWHVPSIKEWQDTCNFIVGSNCIYGMSNIALKTALLLPYSGSRRRSNGLYFDQGISGLYWSSSPSGTTSYNLLFNSTNIWATNANFRAYSLSVRCIKN